jgi:hypothetical protein
MKKKKPEFKEQKVFGCRMSNNIVTLCRCLCKPYKGRGQCGRLAMHGVRGRTQKAIVDYTNRERKSA